MMVEYLSLLLLSIRYPTNIAHEKSHIRELVHYQVSIAKVLHYFKFYFALSL